MKKRLRRVWRDAGGSFTLEAAMVFPVILMVTFLVVLFALYVAQKAIVYYEASAAAERAAFSWSNSAKELRTGAYPSGRYESLYWRLTEDRMLAGLFGLETKALVSVPGNGGGKADGGGLAERKLAAAANSLKASVAGEWSYSNSVLVRRLAGEASNDSVPESLRILWPAAEIRTEAAAVVVEPAEFIRTVDLVRYYTLKIRGSSDGEEPYRSKALAVLKARLPS